MFFYYTIQWFWGTFIFYTMEHIKSKDTVHNIEISRGKINLETANNISFLISIIISIHTALYSFIESHLFTKILLAIICPLFFINIMFFYFLYTQQQIVFKSFSLFYLGNLIAYTIFFIPNKFALKSNYFTIAFLLIIYCVIFLYRSIMHYIYHFNGNYKQFDEIEIHSENGIVVHIQDRIFDKKISRKNSNWWHTSFRYANYSSNTENHVKHFAVDSKTFYKWFEPNYSTVIVSNIISTYTDNKFTIDNVYKLTNDRIHIHYTDLGDSNSYGNCYENINEFWFFEKIRVKVTGPMNSNNHIYKRSDRVDLYDDDINFKYALSIRICNYGWFKDLHKIIQSKNTCKQLPPLSYQERIQEKDKFIESLPQSNNTKRLSKYLCECINWYHGLKCRKTATLEYRIRWQQHKKWILNSPIKIEDIKCNVIIEIQDVVKEEIETTTIQKSEKIDHFPKSEFEATVYPASRDTPPVVKQGDKNIPAAGYKMKDYRVKVKAKCNCGEFEEFKIKKEYSNKVKINNKLEDPNYAEDWTEMKSKSEELSTKYYKKVMEVSKKTFKNENRFEILEIDVPAIEPLILSHNIIEESVPTVKKYRNIFFNNRKQKFKKIKKIAEKQVKDLLKNKDIAIKDKYSRAKKDYSRSRPGNDIIQRRFVYTHNPELKFEEWFKKLNKINNFPEANPAIMNDLGTGLNNSQLAKKYKLSRKHVLFLISNVKMIWNEKIEYDYYLKNQDNYGNFI